MRQLRRIGFFILLIAATAAITGAGMESVARASVGPVAVAEATAFVFPALMEGTEAKHDFVIRNTGDAPLIIKEVKTG